MAIVTLNPGDNVASIVAANPSGSTYNFNPGTYRMQSITPKSNDIYQAATGLLGSVILTGAKILAPGSFVPTGTGLYSIGGQTQQNTFGTNYNLQPGHDGGAYPEQLWIDGVLYEHVALLSEVLAGSQKWFFDYAADVIYIPVNPAGRLIETSVSAFAFDTTATAVHINTLVVEKYANAHQTGAIYLRGQSGVVDTCEVRHNHGTGVKLGGNAIVRNCNIHHQGQLGYGIGGLNGKVLNNEIAYNNTAFFGSGTFAECGGGKAAVATDCLIQGNFAHHNHGAGLWTDVNCIRAIYDSNIVEDNDWRGIFDEVGYNTVIKNNQVRRNGFNNPNTGQGPVADAGILVSSCRDVEVYGNIVEDNKNGITAQETDRPTPTPPTGFGPHDTVNLNVHNNTIKQLDTGRAAGMNDADPNVDPYTAAANNKWHDNTYIITSSAKYYWNSKDNTQAVWQALPQDVGSTFTVPAAAPALARGQWTYDAVAKKLYVRLPDGSSPIGKPMVAFDWRFGMEEIMMITTAGVLKGRLCHHYSHVGSLTSDVDAFRGADVSYDGSRVLFNSNWGGGQLGIFCVLTDPRL